MSFIGGIVHTAESVLKGAEHAVFGNWLPRGVMPREPGQDGGRRQDGTVPATARYDRRTTTMSRPQFRPIREHVAELAAFAASHTPEEVRQEIDRLPPGVRRKVLDAASRGAFSWAERHGKQTQGRFELGEDGRTAQGA